MISKALIRLVVASAVISLAGCNAQPPRTRSAQAPAPVAGAMPDQQHLCEVHDWQRDVTTATCTAGQKIVFLPDRFGNEQLPILFAAVNCDLRYAVALTNGGVACIYLGSVTAAGKR